MENYSIFKITIPRGFKHLCFLLEINPEQIIQQFVDSIGKKSLKHLESEIESKLLDNLLNISPIKRCPFSHNELKEILDEMLAINQLLESLSAIPGEPLSDDKVWQNWVRKWKK